MSVWQMELREINFTALGTVLNYGRLIQILSLFKCRDRRYLFKVPPKGGIT